MRAKALVMDLLNIIGLKSNPKWVFMNARTNRKLKDKGTKVERKCLNCDVLTTFLQHIPAEKEPRKR